jgi:hypothetical protein
MLLGGFSYFWILGGEDGANSLEVLKTEKNLLPRLELQTTIQNALYSPRSSHSVAILFKFHPSSVYPKTASRPFSLLSVTSTQQEQLTNFSSRTTKKATSPQAH